MRSVEGKPPKHTQFKKGDGRHRPGRPKGSKNMVTMVLEAARDQVPVTIDGKKRKISKAQAAAINLANAAATGNPKFVLQFIDLIAGIEASAEAARPSEYPFSEVDKKVIHELYKRLRPYDESGGRLMAPSPANMVGRNLPARPRCIHPPLIS